MVLPAIPVAVWGLLRLIAWLSSITLVSGYVRDIVTKIPGEDIPLSRDQTIDEILDDGSLTDEQKTRILTEYLNAEGVGSSTGLEKYIPMAIVGYIFASVLKG
jgi:hypothetical protein